MRGRRGRFELEFAATMKRRLICFWAILICSTALRAQILTNQLTELGSWDLPYPVGETVFHAGSSSIFALQTGHQKLLQLSLADGAVIQSYDLSREGGTLALSPDNNRLYVALPDPSGGTNGRLAVIDAVQATKLRELALDLSPYDLVATDNGIVFVSGYRVPDYGPTLGTYDGVTGTRLGTAGAMGQVGLSMVANQTAVYAGEYDYVRQFSLDPVTGSLTSLGLSPQQSYPVAIENRVFAHPDGVHVLSRGGRVGEGLKSGKVLQTGFRFESVAFDIPRHSFFIVASSRSNLAEAWLMQYHSETFEMGMQFPIDPATRFVWGRGGELFLLATRTNGATLSRFAHPAVAGETNLSPHADFAWLPSAPVTYAPVQFNGNLSTDEDPGTLSYRWDWDNNGTYDTAWSLAAVAHYTFNLAGKKTVALQVKDRYGAVHRVEKTITVQLASDFGMPAETNVPYNLPFTAADVVFDPTTPTAYFADATRNRLVELNLETGLAERDFWLQFTPTNLALTPGGRTLYASLVVRPPPVNVQTSFVTQVDLQLRARTFDFPLNFEPTFLLPTELDLLIAGAGSRLATYRISSGLGAWMTNFYTVASPTLHPSQTNFYDAGRSGYSSPAHYGLNSTSGALSSLWSPTGSRDWGGLCFADPRGTNLLLRSGYTCSSSFFKSNDMVYGKRFFTGTVERVAFDLPRHSLFALATPTGTTKTNVYYFNSDSLELVSTLTVSNGTHFVMAYPQWVYAVALRTNGTFIFRVPHPAGDGETNQAPAARFVYSPTNPTTLATVRFDAGGSTDDQDTTAQLAYRWDWDGNGVFDTSFANVSTNAHRFNVAGVKTVVLEVKDHLGATARATNSFEVVLQEDPGYAPSSPNVPFELPFAVGDMVFEKTRPYSYAADTLGRRLARIDLRTGLIERYFDFDFYPALLSLSADGAGLYVGTLLASNQAVNPKPTSGFISCFDLARGVKLREFEVPVNPYSIAALGSNHLAVCRGYGGGYYVFETGAGNQLSLSSPYLYGGVVAEPSQAAVLFASYGTSDPKVGLLAVDPVTGLLSDSVYTGAQGSAASKGRIFPVPGASLAVDRGAAVFRYSLSPSNSIEWVRNLMPFSVESLSTDPVRPAFFTVGTASDGSSALVYYSLGSLEATAVYPDTNRLSFVHATAETLYLVAVESQRSWIQRRPNPAAGSETNQAPMAVFAWSPTQLLSGACVHLDGSASRDDLDSPAQLRYRWDWTDDGVFDTSFTNCPSLDLPLTEAGTLAVTLEVMDRFGATARTRQRLPVLPGPGANANFGLQFGAGAAVFDRQRPLLYVTDPNKGRLVWLNLETAQIEHELDFHQTLGPLALHPVDDRLYLALMSPPTDTNASGAATIVGIDLSTRSMVQQFDINVGPFDMVISTNGYLVASPASGQWVNTRAYRLATGQETGAVFLQHRCRLAMHPAGAAVYLADTDLSPPSLVKCSLDPVTGALVKLGSGPEPSYYLFMHPQGDYLLLGSGAVVTTLSGSQPDMGFLCQLTNAALQAATFDLDHRALFAAGFLWDDPLRTCRLFQFQSDTFVPVADYPCVGGTCSLCVSGRYLYGVAPQPDHTVVWRQLNPATVIRLEQPVRIASGQFQVTVRGTPGNRVVIAASVDLAKWDPILTNTLEGATWSFQSPIGTEPARYYRAEIAVP